MTARECALDMIRPYVLRGDDYDQFKGGMMGSYNKDYHAQIGGFVHGKRYGTDKLVVSEVEGAEVESIFSLKELWQELKVKQMTLWG